MKPELTVIIATFNSEKILPKVFAALKKQIYPRRKLEIIAVDGGSHDSTLIICRKFGAKIIKNPRTEPVYGKYLAFTKACGMYVMYLDHDEVLTNKNSIANKVMALKANQDLKVIVSSGYKSPKGYPFINDYINEFGDPFSFFMYRLSKRDGFFVSTMEKRYPIKFENKYYQIFDLSKTKVLPLLEIISQGNMFNASTLKKEFPATIRNNKLVTHLFYIFNLKYPYVAVAKNDAIIHYSADTLEKYINKIVWRIKNNIFFEEMAETGFRGRNKYQPKMYGYKKYLFLPYSLTLVLPTIDAVYLAITRKNIKYLLHTALIFFTGIVIVYYYINYILGRKLIMKSYDGKKVIGKSFVS